MNTNYTISITDANGNLQGTSHFKNKDSAETSFGKLFTLFSSNVIAGNLSLNDALDDGYFVTDCGKTFYYSANMDMNDLVDVAGLGVDRHSSSNQKNSESANQTRRFAVFHNAFGDRMSLVAILNACSLDEVFRKTNSVDNAWYENDEIDAFIPEGQNGIRSTSSGDFIYDVTYGSFFCSIDSQWVECKDDQYLHEVSSYDDYGKRHYAEFPFLQLKSEALQKLFN